MTLPTTVARTVQQTQGWLQTIAPEIEARDEDSVWAALRGVLTHLRDRMPPNEAAQLGAQLPTLVRGLYYEGWSPAATPEKERTGDAFLVRVAEAIGPHLEIDPERAARAVFSLLDRELDAGEIDQVIHNLPAQVKALWPEAAQARSRAKFKH